MSGKTFGKLLVVKRIEDYVSPSGYHKIRYKCKCNCEDNKYVEVVGSQLTSGCTKSCGCYKKEELKERIANGCMDALHQTTHKINTYDLSNDYGIGYTRKNEEFYFDLEDYDKIKDYCWSINNNGYVCSVPPNTISRQKKAVQMQNIVLPSNNPNIIVDHIYGINNDNRKSQLRYATIQQNGFNRKIGRNNKSGVIGVYYDKKKKRWKASLKVNQKQINLGSFIEKEDAINARKEAEKKYFGDFALSQFKRRGDKNE